MYTKYNYTYMSKVFIFKTCEHKIKSFTIEYKHLIKNNTI